jgi:diketogulonate reductase-like aldo/keto reductase
MATRISRKKFLNWSAGLTGSLLMNGSGNYFKSVTASGIPYQMLRDNMIQRAIPSSGEKLPAIGMGTWLTFDAGNSEVRRKSLKEVLRIFRASGGKLIDSSPMYGSSEKVVGDLVKDLAIRKQIFLATKVWTSGEHNGIEQMEHSFERMQTATMDLMQVHNLVDVETHLKTLRKWKEAGKARYIGITHYIVSAYPQLVQLIKTEKPDFVQFNFNIRVRDAEKMLLPFCSDNGIAVINNRPFDGGGLFENVRGKPLPAWAKDFGIENWAQFFLKYIISHPSVTCAIPATSNPEHMKENMGAPYGLLPTPEVRKKMVDFFEAL